MGNDISGLMAGLAVLRMAPVVEITSPASAKLLTRVSVLATGESPIERRLYAQWFKFYALRSRDLPEEDPRYLTASAGEVAVIACLPGFSYTGDRSADLVDLVLEFWESCDDLIAEGAPGPDIHQRAGESFESLEKVRLESDRESLTAASDAGLEYGRLAVQILNLQPAIRDAGMTVARAAGWESRT